MYSYNNRTGLTGLIVLFLFIILSPRVGAELEKTTDTPTARIAIIIDDIGYRRADGLAALALPGALTYSILPFTPNAKDFARRAERRDRELLLHLPMESKAGDKLGPGGLTTEMSAKELGRLVSESLQAVPNIKGVNNHMGSHFTANYNAMSIVMSAIGRRAPQLFFVDSVTTSNSTIPRAGRTHGIPVISRNIFLDHVLSKAAIRAQFNQLTAHARKHGRAVAIGHPHPETVSVLREELTRLREHGVSLVSVSDLISKERAPHLQAD